MRWPVHFGINSTSNVLEFYQNENYAKVLAYLQYNSVRFSEYHVEHVGIHCTLSFISPSTPRRLKPL